MADNSKSDSSKPDAGRNTSAGPGKPVDTAAAKKPSAIIDLKATEIAVKDTQQTAGAVAKAETASKALAGQSAASNTSTTGTGTTAGSVPKSGSTSSSAPGATTASALPKQDPGRPAAKPAVYVPPAKKSGGLGSFISHAGAGVLGGFLALFGADAMSQRFGVNVRPAAGSTGGGSTTVLEQRLAVLEQAAKASGGVVPGDAGAKLAAAEARLAKLEDLSKALAALPDAQAKLAADTKALSEQVTAPLGQEPQTRLARLEETLATLTAVAATDPQKGRIPQLAQLSAKLADLESALTTQLAATRKGITAELDNRLGQAQEASEAAKTGTVRLDRDLATVKTDAARTAQAVETLGGTIKSVQADAGTLKSEIDGLASQLKTVTRPQDVSSALAPFTSKLSGLEQNVQGVIKNEDDRKAQSERMVLALELGNLKRALDRGGSFAREFADVEKVAGGKLDLTGIARFKDQGVPTQTSLSNDFRTIAHSIIAADAEPANGSVVDRLLASAKGVVRVRKVAAGADDKSAEAVVARIEAALKAGRLADIADEAKTLSPRARANAEGWLAKVDVRGQVDRSVAAIEAQLKAALSGKS